VKLKHPALSFYAQIKHIPDWSDSGMKFAVTEGGRLKFEPVEIIAFHVYTRVGSWR
jgi:hypothetical protein